MDRQSPDLAHLTRQALIDLLVEAAESGDLAAKLLYGPLLVARRWMDDWRFGRDDWPAPFAPFGALAENLEELVELLVDDDLVSEERALELEDGAELTVEERRELLEQRTLTYLSEEAASVFWTIREVVHSRGQRAYIVLITGSESDEWRFVQVQPTYSGAIVALKESGYIGVSDFYERRALLSPEGDDKLTD